MSSSRLNKLAISFARKWQCVCGIISTGRRSMISKGGHFVVYTLDNRRFVFPLAYLETDMFRELLRLSEQVFGLPADRPITLPCHSLFLQHYCVCVASYPALSRTATSE